VKPKRLTSSEKEKLRKKRAAVLTVSTTGNVTTYHVPAMDFGDGLRSRDSVVSKIPNPFVEGVDPIMTGPTAGRSSHSAVTVASKTERKTEVPNSLALVLGSTPAADLPALSTVAGAISEAECRAALRELLSDSNVPIPPNSPVVRAPTA
jgi:hypothetical protein